MGSIKDEAESVEDQDLEDLAESLNSESSESNEVNDLGNGLGSRIKDIIGAEPPPKPLKSYQDHALNFDGSDSTSKIIKGFEGMLTGLNKAILLVVIGVVEKYTEKKQDSSKTDSNNNDVVSGEMEFKGNGDWNKINEN